MVLRRVLLACVIAVFPCAGVAATFTVNTTTDLADTSPGDGVCATSASTCSLRAAIQEANTTAALDTIAFAIAGAGVKTIRPASPLPAVTQPVVLDGLTQPGASPNTEPRDGNTAVLLIELDLTTGGSLVFDGGGSTVRGMVVNRGVNGLHFRTGTSYAVEACFIGTDPAGTSPRGNVAGIRLEAPGTRIGSPDPAHRNVISGNMTGIFLPCPQTDSCHAGTVIMNSYIGASKSLGALPNGTGINGTNTNGLVIGGTVPGSGNVISGNSGNGINLSGRGPVHHSTVAGNRIGLGATGQVPQPLPNGQRGIRLEMFCIGPPCIDPVFVVDNNGIAYNLDGVWIDGGALTLTRNFIANNVGSGVETAGGITTRGAMEDNQISRNGSAGILIDTGQFSLSRNIVVENGQSDGSAGIVVTASGAVVMGANRLFDNIGLGIDLGANGVTPNDAGDGDAGPNGLQNFPVLTSACSTGGTLSLRGTLNSQPNRSYTVEVFWSDDCDPSGHGEGAVQLLSLPATTGADGNASFSLAQTAPIVPGLFLAATATAPTGTSELGACVLVTTGTPPPAQTIAGPSAVCSGAPLTLHAIAGGDSYQWLLNGTPIPGATAPTYSRGAAGAGDAGSYTVRASRCGLDATSPPHAVSVVTCTTFPVRLDVDVHVTAGTLSDLDRVLESGEIVLVEPRYRNDAAVAQSLTGSASLTGPPPATYALPDAAAAYGATGPGQLTDCFTSTGDCYRATVGGSRPQAHWDATFVETTSGGDPARHWPLHVGDSFTDVPRADAFYRFVETILHNGVTAGCSATTYCPAAPATRQQMAVFVLVAREGPSYSPPACNPAAPRFTDIPASSPFCRWVEELARRQVVSGCGGNTYCPVASVSREQMAVFVLATREAPGYTPPTCVAGAELFTDVPASNGFCRWIEELARRGVVSGCGNGRFCPGNPISRGEMSVFLTVTFGLLLYGP